MTDAASSRRRLEGVGYLLAGLLALVPIVRMALLVRGASPLQYSDYWLLFEHFTLADGGLDVAGMFDFEHQNHPVVLPILAYWGNAQLFAGSNVALGAFVVVLALGMLAAVALLLGRSDIRPVDRMFLFVAAAYLLFSQNGAWNYLRAMSGTAWLGAGLVGLVAVHLRSRDRAGLAFAACVVAVVTYATGLMVWPAVAAVGACRRKPRDWWREWPYVVGFVVSYLWYREVQTAGLGTEVLYPTVAEAIPRLAQLLVFPLGPEGVVAAAMGYVVLVVLAGLIGWFAARSSSANEAAWVGIATFGLLATTSLAFGRYTLVAAGAQHRYTSVPAVALIGLAGLLALAAREVRTRSMPTRALTAAISGIPLAFCAVVVVLASTAGRQHVQTMRDGVPAQELREIALRLDLADGTTYVAGFPEWAALATNFGDRLINLGHHPFVDGWDLDCGLIDEGTLPSPSPAGEVVGVVLDAQRLVNLRGAIELTGEISSPRPLRCVVVADEQNRVIGAATLRSGDDPSTDATSFTALARPGATTYRVFAIFRDSPTPVTVGESDPPPA